MEPMEPMEHIHSPGLCTVAQYRYASRHVPFRTCSALLSLLINNTGLRLNWAHATRPSSLHLRAASPAFLEQTLSISALVQTRSVTNA